MFSQLSSDIRCRNDLSMSDLTTFKIGGVAKIVYEPRNAQEVSELMRYFRERQSKFFVLGNGSNVLMPDGAIDMPILHIGSEMSAFEVKNTSELTVGAGLDLSVLVQKALEYSLTGLEFAHCIPGTVGGAVFMNAGAFDGEMKDIVQWIEMVDSEGNIFTVTPGLDFFGHRYSLAQSEKWIITRVGISLEHGDFHEIEARMKEIRQRRNEKQPLDFPSAGSVFKRPRNNYASKLIDDAGLKGVQIGGARVSEKHGGFIINVGGATAEDVIRLMKYVSDVVEEKNGIRLEPEIVVVSDSAAIF